MLWMPPHVCKERICVRWTTYLLVALAPNSIGELNTLGPWIKGRSGLHIHHWSISSAPYSPDPNRVLSKGRIFQVMAAKGILKPNSLLYIVLKLPTKAGWSKIQSHIVKGFSAIKQHDSVMSWYIEGQVLIGL